MNDNQMVDPGYKVRCERCRCFILTADIGPFLSWEELLPVPSDGCDKTPECVCHTGRGLLPQLSLTELASMEEHASHYRNITSR